jgi:hypothetical protein
MLQATRRAHFFSAHIIGHVRPNTGKRNSRDSKFHGNDNIVAKSKSNGSKNLKSTFVACQDVGVQNFQQHEGPMDTQENSSPLAAVSISQVFRCLFVALIILLGVLLFAALKGLPPTALFSLVAILGALGTLVAVGIRMGFSLLLASFLGRHSETLKMACVGLGIVATVVSVLALMAVMANLQNPEKIGPGIAAAFTGALTPLMLIAYLVLVNKINPKDQKSSPSQIEGA